VSVIIYVDTRHYYSAYCYYYYTYYFRSMRLIIAKTRVISYSRKTNILRYEYQLCHTAIKRTSNVTDVGVFFDSKLYFCSHVDFLFFECIKLLGLNRSITLRFSYLDCLCVLYFTFFFYFYY
jgi:hypothetical protein